MYPITSIPVHRHIPCHLAVQKKRRSSSRRRKNNKKQWKRNRNKTLPAKVQCTLFLGLSAAKAKEQQHKGIYRVMVWTVSITGIDANIVAIYIVGILFLCFVSPSALTFKMLRIELDARARKEHKTLILFQDRSTSLIRFTKNE